MDIVYGPAEYGILFCALIFLTFIWPAVVFRPYLKSQSKTYVLSFCVTVQVVLITVAVLLLGVCHPLYQWILAALFYGIFAMRALQQIPVHFWTAPARVLIGLLTGMYRPKPFLHDVWNGLKRNTGRAARSLWNKLRPNWLEYTILGVLIVFGMLYFSYGAFQSYAYGASDMYVHLQRIDALPDGNTFVAAIYPRAMHCFVYSLNTLFGISLYNCIQLLAGMQILETLIAAHLFLRSVFRWKYRPSLC